MWSASSQQEAQIDAMDARQKPWTCKAVSAAWKKNNHHHNDQQLCVVNVKTASTYMLTTHAQLEEKVYTLLEGGIFCKSVQNKGYYNPSQ